MVAAGGARKGEGGDWLPCLSPHSPVYLTHTNTHKAYSQTGFRHVCAKGSSDHRRGEDHREEGKGQGGVRCGKRGRALALLRQPDAAN